MSLTGHVVVTQRLHTHGDDVRQWRRGCIKAWPAAHPCAAQNLARSSQTLAAGRAAQGRNQQGCCACQQQPATCRHCVPAARRACQQAVQAASAELPSAKCRFCWRLGPSIAPVTLHLVASLPGLRAPPSSSRTRHGSGLLGGLSHSGLE